MNPRPDRGTIRELVELACRAPSVHNTQPWRWVYADGALSLFADKSRKLDVADPQGRQMIISCGAALGTAETAATAFKWTPTMEPVLSARPLDPLARLRLVMGARPRSHEFDLLSAINRRRSDRRAFGRVPDERALTDAMRAAAAASGVSVSLVPADAHDTLVAASRQSAALRRYDWTYQAELRWWAGHASSAAGIPPRNLLSAQDRRPVDVGRDFPARFPPSVPGPSSVAAPGAAPAELDMASILVLGTTQDRRIDWLRSGRALSAILLEATVDGLSTCPLTHLTEEPHSRALVRTLTADGDIPQVLVRVGTVDNGRRPEPTPRRAVDSVLSVA